ncbi:MAG: valine--tRNA ligase [Deltaproteobacteria bacterium]|nr:valine--tRNA ligase [Deltaproteobacteria bacterium]
MEKTVTDLPKSYEPKSVESKWYAYWETHGLFHAPDTTTKKPYAIVIPPPNVTGALHMGHALNNTIQDILIRWKKMSGYESVWIPGTDHAGIATQNVVERDIWKTEKKRRQDLGREAVIDRIWKWKEEYGNRILTQLRALGSACDWERTRFTLDEGLSKAVRECFVKLYEEGLIYRGKYIVNWCPRCRTALADDEVDHKESKGKLWHLRYPLADNSGFIIVATTRPETMLGDTAVAVNPKDPRYTKLIGKMVKLPETNREIPIIADDFVDASFGSGAVKVTPAHDPNDFQMGKRHNLPQINVMREDASMSDEAPEKYRGLTREACRTQIIEAFEAQGLLEKIDDHQNAVGHCYRSDTIIEPWLSDQWFVRMRPLAEKAIRASEEKKVVIHPERWNAIYLQWLENVRDWCISRQIWWGHRIPVWYCKKGNCPPIVARETPATCPHCESAQLEQDSDVLDTWFSSALWPFSTLGWPEKTAALKTYYPTSTLVTDRGIIYFWVARMVMMGLHHMNAVPFSDVYIHGTILDEHGAKMSKSKGNVIDPLKMIDTYGTDALRFSLIMLSSEGQDVKLSETKFEMGRNFCNKLWNAARFALMNLEGMDRPSLTNLAFSTTDKWILTRLETVIAETQLSLEEFRFHEALAKLYQFFWNDFCDWYVEVSKSAFTQKGSDTHKAAQQTLYAVLSTSLKLFHPFMPFITEELWSHLPHREETSIMSATFPAPQHQLSFAAAANEFETVKEVVTAIRNIRGEHGVPPSKQISAFFIPADHAASKTVSSQRTLIEYMGRLNAFEITTADHRPQKAALAVISTGEIFVPYEGLIDIEAEKERLGKEILKVEKEKASVETKLADGKFMTSAPTHIIEQQRTRLTEAEQKMQKLKKALADLI